ncbi:MAG: YiiX/YebB-like N1pC/P60 family cysteine hydrolase [Phycisphaerae bacterium]
MTKRLLTVSALLAAGCQMTPIPPSVEKFNEQAKRDVPVLEPVLKEGDIIFRLSRTPLAGGLVDFSKVVAEATESDLSHAALIYRIAPDGVILVDVSPVGISRRYLVDWYQDGTWNTVVRRLRPEYQYLVPLVLAEVDRLIAEDVIYDEKFVPDDDRFYCTELIDHCFRVAGRPLARRIRIKDFPNNSLIMYIGCAIGGIDMNNEVVVAGNERIGLFSSSMLETVIDLRTSPPTTSPRPDPVLTSYRPVPWP